MAAINDLIARMITSGSSNREFHRLFDEHLNEHTMRLVGILKNKYRRTILILLKKGNEIPAKQVG